jgi:DNA-binding transcriptional MerR regulator
MGERFTIGHLAREAGIKVQTVRYYEQQGLLPPAPRSAGNQRLYDDRVRRRLTFIRHARELGFPLEAVRELLELADRPDRPCDRADEIARRQLEAVERRIARLEALRTELSRMIAHCATGSVADCRVIETLSDHSLCLADHPTAEDGLVSPSL